jgi:hypothetical protein
MVSYPCTRGCDRRFATLKDAANHAKRCSGVKHWWRCKPCGFKSAMLSKLRRHLMSGRHRKAFPNGSAVSKKFPCGHCSKRFTTAVIARTHERACAARPDSEPAPPPRSDVCKVTCPFEGCGTSVCKRNLQRHLALKHGQGKMHICFECRSKNGARNVPQFLSQAALENHMLSMHR